MDLCEKIDICSIPSKTSTVGEDISINYFVQLDVFHTGFYYYATNDVKSDLDFLRENKKPLARINIKINNYNLLDEKLHN